MNQQLDEEAGGILAQGPRADGHDGPHREADHGDPGVRRRRERGGVHRTAARSTATWSCVTAGIRPNVGLGVVSGLTVERAIVIDDQMRSVDDPDIYAVGECAQHRGEVYGLVAPLWEQAVVLADHVTGANPKAAYHGSRIATKLKVVGVDVASMGVKGPEKPDDEFVRFAEPKRGIYKSRRDPRRQADRRDAARRHQEGRVPDPELRPRAAAARGARRDALRARRAERGAGRGRDGRLGAGLQLQRRVQGRSRRLRARRRAQRHGLYERDPRRQGLRVVQAAGRATSSSGPCGERRRGRRRRERELVRPRDPDGQARR